MEATAQRNALDTAAAVPDFTQHELTATVQSYRFFPATGWTIVDLTSGQTATGEFEADELTAGVSYRFFGTWITHSRYGPQFAVDSYVVEPPATEAGTIAYLTRSGLQITRADARLLWSEYGVLAAQRLRESPDEVSHVTGIVLDKCETAARVLAEQAADEPAKIELFTLFSGRGFPRGAVKACIRKWGRRAPQVVKRDPYSMLVAGIPGVGFRRADALYLDRGGNPAKLRRAMLAGWHWMRNEGTGNTWELTERVIRSMAINVGGFEVNYDRAVRLGVRSGWLAETVDAAGNHWLAEWENASNERKIALHARRIAKHAALWARDLGPELSDHQREKVTPLLASPLAILAGTPGTGKTFTAAALIRGLLQRSGTRRLQVKVMAPTGKAAVRITEAMQRYHLPLQATTIHTGLGVCGHATGKAQFSHDELNPLDCDLVVVDEASMIDTDIMAALLAAIPPRGNLLLLGDPHQLPPVGHGAPLRDLINAGCPTALLTEIQRNAGDIVLACAAIKDGKIFNTSAKIDPDAGLNLKHVPAATPDEQAALVVNLLDALRQRGFNPTWDVQILCARNDGEHVGRRALNVALQAYLNPETEPDERRRNLQFRKADKVMCLKNTLTTEHFATERADPTAAETYRPTNAQIYVANGDMGRVLATSPGAVVVQFSGPDRLVKVSTERRKKSDDGKDGGDKGPDFDLAYAVTTHKSQGSEWPVVVYVLDDGAGRIGCRELIYTGISRAQKLCLLVGKLPTAFKMIGRVELAKRKTFLRELLTTEVAP